jgi:choline-sulfatase
MATRPHVVLVIADQLSAAALPSYGNTVALTPHLDRLAEEGVVFERAYCASPLCAPSRAALMTGLPPSRTGVYDNAAILAADVPTFAHSLRALGYRTVLAGKMHFIGPDQLHGFEERLVPDVYPAGLDWIPDWRLADDETLPWYHDLSSVLRAGPVTSTLQLRYDAEVAEQACRAIADSAREASRPLLLVASFTHPHDPYEVPPEYWYRYEGMEIDAPVYPDPPEPVDAPTRRLRAMVASDRIDVSPDQVLRARHGYYGAISLVDDHVGAILATLAANDLSRETVVVVTSDHGDMLGERGLWYKMAPFDASTRVPLLVHAPGRFPARRVAQPVSLLDLASTLTDLAGGDPLPSDGVTLAGALRGDDAPARTVFLEYLAEGVRAPQVTVMRGSLKLVHELGGEDLLFDLEADPEERINLAGTADRGGEHVGLAAAADARWDLVQLDADVRASQERRRLVARALAVGRAHDWDHPAEDPAGPYIRSGQDFWATLEAAREP